MFKFNITLPPALAKLFETPKHIKPPKQIGTPMKVFARLNQNPPITSRAERRNLARKNHDLGAWKKPRNHLMTRSGSVVVPYPFHELEGR